MGCRLNYRLALILGAFVTYVPAQGMDCTLSRTHEDPTWKASCGLQRAGPRWTGIIQGPLNGSRLTFSNTHKQKHIEGGILSPLSMLSEIPSCNSDAATTNENCKAISKKISLPLPFTLISYTQDPISFTIGSQWDERTKSIARGSELVIAACGIGPAKKPDETSPLLYFRKTMDCKWRDQTLNSAVPDFSTTLAVNCQSPVTSGILQVNTGSIQCELRQKDSKEKLAITDSIPVVCIPANGKPGTPESIDPITCLADNRIGFTTQSELREKRKAPRNTKTTPSARSATGANGT